MKRKYHKTLKFWYGVLKRLSHIERKQGVLTRREGLLWKLAEENIYV